jgi:hypothetical protein
MHDARHAHLYPSVSRIQLKMAETYNIFSVEDMLVRSAQIKDGEPVYVYVVTTLAYCVKAVLKHYFSS